MFKGETKVDVNVAKENVAQDINVSTKKCKDVLTAESSAKVLHNMRIAPAVTVVAAYAGGTTTNMTADNQASNLGLDSNWPVLANKNGNNNYPGLNKAGEVRLYGNPSNIISFAYSAGTIVSIKINYTANNYSNGLVKVGGAAVTGDGGVYNINSTEFTLENGNSNTTQVRFSSIEIVVIPNA